MILGLFAIAMLNVTKAVEISPIDQLPANCIAYSDGCNVCSRNTVKDQRLCTLRACLIDQTHAPVCTAYAAWSTSGAVACTMDYTPVCGEVAVQCIQAPCPPIKETFGNLCTLKAQWNATFLYNGECKVENPPTACTMQYDPVCAEVTVQCFAAPCPAIKETFGNACMMNASQNAKFLYNGECKIDDTPVPTVACTKEYNPVCGVTQTQIPCEWEVCYPIDQIQQTYGNMCMLKAANAQILYAGECKNWLEAGEWFVYGKVSSILDKSYLAWAYTPIQAYNYTQTIIDKIDAKLQVSRMRKRAYDRHIQLKRFLQTYMIMMQITQ